MAERCKQLTDETKKAADKIRDIKKWAIRDGIRQVEGDKTSGKDEKEAQAKPDPEASDPDLVFKVKGVLQIGQKLDSLIATNPFCAKEVRDEKDVLDAEPEEDEDKNDVLDDLKKDPTREWFGDKKEGKKKKKDDEDDEDDDEDEEEDEPKVITRYQVKYVQVNMSAMVELLEFDHDLEKKVDEFETEVHPHGFKWWRYRYEYSILESFVLAYSVMLLYILKFFIFGLSFFRVHKFYRTGRPSKIYRYPFIYFVFHAACVCIMVFLAYMMYVPWGKSNFFNLFATAFHDFVDGAFNAPYLGYSWLFLILDIQFQLFATYAMYAIFVAMVAKNYIAALNDWRLIDDPNSEAVDYEFKKLEGKLSSPQNAEIYAKLKKVVSRRVEVTKSLRNLFYEKQLRLVGVEKLDSKVPAADNKHWHDFKLHLYLTEGLGKSIEYLVEVSLVTNLWLAICALIVALLAHTCQMAFMYFLPGFVVISFGLFVAGYLMSKYYIRLAEDLNYQMPNKEPDSDIDDHESRTAPEAKAPFGFKTGQKVMWIGKDMEKVPDMSTGTITGFTSDKVKVMFKDKGHNIDPKGEYALPPHLLVKAKADFVNCHSYCRAVQITLYCVFYSFARLLLSQDIFTHYPKVYLSACLALGLVFVFLAFFGGQLMKEATCALILVPHISYAEFKKHLDQIVKWHIQVNCHECGVGQLDYKRSFSGEWAGNQTLSRKSGEASASPRTSMYSFR